ncbi:MAG: EAL domain-containing protein [Solibacillus sp.]
MTTLKIDKSFVDDVPRVTKDASILQFIVQLGQSLNNNIVVEGVETEEQVQFLVEHCNSPQIQGYYFAKPMKTDELESWCHAFTMKMNV